MDKRLKDTQRRDRKSFPIRAYPGLIMVESSGIYVKDVEGNSYIDMTCSSCILGHRHPKVISAIKTQLDKFDHIYASFVIPSEAYLINAEVLKSIVPGKLKKGKVVYFGSGTETVTFAKKLVKNATGKQAIFAHIGAHHGRLLDVSADNASVKKGYAPCLVDCLHVPFPYCYRCVLNHTYPECDLACVDYIETVLDTVMPPENIGAFLFEPLQSWNGFIVPPDEYFPKLKKLCQKHEILLIDDEIMTGFGRTGKMFAMEHWNIEPDIICLGKGIGMGFPGNNALIAPAKMIDNWPDSWGGTVGSTGGHPIACVASITGLEVIKENNLVSKAAENGRVLHQMLQELASKYDIIGAVNGRGLLSSIYIVNNNAKKTPSPKKTSKIVDFALKKGLLLEKGIGTYNNVIRFIPPLIITSEELQIMTDILTKALRNLSS